MATYRQLATNFGNGYAPFVAVTANCLFFFTGISLSWPSPVLVKLNGTDGNPLGNPISQEQNDLIGSLFSIGGALGPILLIYALELLGRKSTMTILACIFPLFYLLLAFAENIYLYYVSRIATGIAAGGSISIISIYVSEIVPVKYRGTYIALGTCFILSGSFFSYCVGPYTSVMVFNIIIASLGFIYLPVFVFTCPETLYYTMQKYGPEKTMELLKILRKKSDLSEELKIIEGTVGKRETGKVLDLFKSRASTKAFCICSTLMVVQEFSGINAIMTYSQTIFKNAEVSLAPAVCSIIVSAFQSSTSITTPLLSRKIKVKPLLMFSLSGICFSHTLLILYFYVDYIHQFNWIPLVSLIGFVTFCNCGVASLPRVVLGEMYPLKVKAIGTALTSIIYWFAQFLTTYYYNKIDQAVAFLIFDVFCFCGIIFTYFFVIETKGRTFQEIQERLES
ncbi:hypothetical protein WA026_000028 [Henosepilachna vigintioctopunctata]|uniref:Major facilitator superfamily (MFS) profile domain-containing protein n=1 Tax=Henosepilachna vigintioctopunctata TaxID=420089 RepID=A0AAW1V4Q0_9CUCU